MQDFTQSTNKVLPPLTSSALDLIRQAIQKILMLKFVNIKYDVAERGTHAL